MSLERDPVADRIASFLDALLMRDVKREPPTPSARVPSFREFLDQDAKEQKASQNRRRRDKRSLEEGDRTTERNRGAVERISLRGV